MYRRPCLEFNFFLKLNHLPSCLQYFLVKKALKGHKRNNFKIDHRKPITLDILIRLCSITSQVCFSYFESVLFKAVLLLHFLQLSEFLS